MVRRMVRARRRGGFTLLELLVVIAIIVIATGLAMPTIGKFMRAQRLVQTGRMVQSTFNDARRAAITQRARHYVFLGKIRAFGGVGTDVYALHIYREGFGWEPGEPTKLPTAVQPVCDAAGSDVLKGCKLKVQDWTNGLPAADNSDSAGIFDVTKKPVSGVPVHELRKDGTIQPKNGAVSVAIPDANLYDLNVNIDPGTYNANTQADMQFIQVGEPSKMLFLSIDMNTGRVRFRVVDIEAVTGA